MRTPGLFVWLLLLISFAQKLLITDSGSLEGIPGDVEK